MKYTGLIFIFFGGALLLFASLGHWTSLGNYKNGPASGWEKFDPILAKKIDSYAKLKNFTDSQISANSNERETMDILYTTIINSFTYTEATHTFYSNWLLYIAGKIHPVLSHIWDTDLMVSNGNSLLCDQVSYLLVKLALENDIKARHVGLDGHVVMEAWYDSEWHLYDPSFEIIPIDETGQILSVENLAQNKKLLNFYYGKFNKIPNIIGTRENNTYMSYPEGARFVWKAELLVYIEKAMEILKFVIPILFILCGLWLMASPLKRHLRASKTVTKE